MIENKLKKLSVFCCFVFVLVANGQEQLDCEFNVREALFYLKGDKNFQKDSLKTIELLKPCLKAKYANAQLLMGKLYSAKKNKNSYKKAFKLFKKSARQGNAIAMTDLGILYKYGNGCKLNFNKAIKWFKKAAKLDNDKASYSLGYMYLKGFGNIDQDYNKAVKWFKKSEYPMSKYWLGICYYYGYGVDKNIDKASELLNVNFESFESFEDDNSNNTNSNQFTNEITENLNTNTENYNQEIAVTEDQLFGKWTGLLLKYDWSGKHIEQKHPLKIEFVIDSINENAKYKIFFKEKIIVGDLNIIDNAIYFEDIFLKLPHTSFNKLIPSQLNYNLLSSDLFLKKIENTDYLTGNIDSYIHNFSEPGAGLKFILKKKETFANSEDEISDAIIDALALQEQNFIKLYPNPFQTDLIISYTLESTSFVEVKIADINGTKNIILEKGKQQNAGKHNYYFNGSKLDKGVYIVTVITNNERKTKIIVKK